MSADEQTPVELMASQIAPELERLIDGLVSGDGNDREWRAAVKDYLWCNKVGLLRVAQAYGPLVEDLRETLKATLHHCGPGAVNKITSHVMVARRARDSNAEIDKLEQLFGQEEDRAGSVLNIHEGTP